MLLKFSISIVALLGVVNANTIAAAPQFSSTTTTPYTSTYTTKADSMTYCYWSTSTPITTTSTSTSKWVSSSTTSTSIKSVSSTTASILITPITTSKSSSTSTTTSSSSVVVKPSIVVKPIVICSGAATCKPGYGYSTLGSCTLCLAGSYSKGVNSVCITCTGATSSGMSTCPRVILSIKSSSTSTTTSSATAPTSVPPVTATSCMSGYSWINFKAPGTSRVGCVSLNTLVTTTTTTSPTSISTPTTTTTSTTTPYCFDCDNSHTSTRDTNCSSGSTLTTSLQAYGQGYLILCTSTPTTTPPVTSSSPTDTYRPTTITTGTNCKSGGWATSTATDLVVVYCTAPLDARPTTTTGYCTDGECWYIPVTTATFESSCKSGSTLTSSTAYGTAVVQCASITNPPVTTPPASTVITISKPVTICATGANQGQGGCQYYWLSTVTSDSEDQYYYWPSSVTTVTSYSTETSTTSRPVSCGTGANQGACQYYRTSTVNSDSEDQYYYWPSSVTTVTSYSTETSTTSRPVSCGTGANQGACQYYRTSTVTDFSTETSTTSRSRPTTCANGNNSGDCQYYTYYQYTTTVPSGQMTTTELYAPCSIVGCATSPAGVVPYNGNYAGEAVSLCPYGSWWPENNHKTTCVPYPYVTPSNTVPSTVTTWTTTITRPPTTTY